MESKMPATLKKQKNSYCYATTIFGGDNYVAGALAMAHSLTLVKSKYPKICCHTSDVSENAREMLKVVFDEVKLVKCIKGKIIDYIVDIRKNSKTYLDVISFELEANDNKLVYIPEGFAHGFVVTSQNADILYKTSYYYSKQCDVSINPFDPDIDIKWPKNLKFSLSKKDKTAKNLKHLAKHL